MPAFCPTFVLGRCLCFVVFDGVAWRLAGLVLGWCLSTFVGSFPRLIFFAVFLTFFAVSLTFFGVPFPPFVGVLSTDIASAAVSMTLLLRRRLAAGL